MEKTKEQLIAELEELRLRNAQLEASEEKYRNLFERVNDVILTIDMKGNIIDANKKAEEISGYSRKEMPINVLKLIGPLDALKFASRLRKLKKAKKLPPTEYTAKKKNGGKLIIEITSTLIETKGKPKGIMVVARDITDRKRVEEQIKEALNEKEILLKEIHHRVKNNMQIISSLLSLQEGHIKDQAVRKAFKESQARIRSMAMIHEKLYQSEDLAEVGIKDFVESLTADLFITYDVNPDTVSLRNNVKNVYLKLDTAIPCCLLINELVSNSLKYAFPQGKAGEIIITLRSKNNTYRLTVKDNGIGFPKEVDFHNTKSLGLQLVHMFVKKLHGSIKLDNRRGTEINVSFNA